MNTDSYLQIPGGESFRLLKPLVGFEGDMMRRLEASPFNRNVFLMMKFRDSNSALSDFILESLGEHGLNGVRADQPKWNITDNVYNPIAVLYCCKYGIALFDEPEANQAYSANVAYELGMMHLQRKTTLILRHSSLPDTPFDLIKDLHVRYQKDLEVRKYIGEWVEVISAREEGTRVERHREWTGGTIERAGPEYGFIVGDRGESFYFKRSYFFGPDPNPHEGDRVLFKIEDSFKDRQNRRATNIFVVGEVVVGLVARIIPEKGFGFATVSGQLGQSHDLFILGVVDQDLDRRKIRCTISENSMGPIGINAQRIGDEEP